MHPSTAAILKFFTYDHLPAELAEVSAPFADHAQRIAGETSGPETTTCLRKLLEAKDCAVRAHLTERHDGLEQARQTQPEGD